VIVAARFNHGITSRLVAGATAAFRSHGVASEDLELIRVPGAFELPSACKRAIERGGTDAVVALGCVIRGETPHFDFIAGAASRGLADLSVQAAVPVVFGVLTTDTLEQALDRAGPGEENKGWEAAVSALEMANLYAELR
jgi:6,7-dimethyl-8-ribityllumazine synthase